MNVIAGLGATLFYSATLPKLAVTIKEHQIDGSKRNHEENHLTPLQFTDACE